MKQINSSFGSGGMALAMNEVEFSSFILFLKSKAHNMPIRKAASVIGQQPCGQVWVLGKDLQVCCPTLWVKYTSIVTNHFIVITL